MKQLSLLFLFLVCSDSYCENYHFTYSEHPDTKKIYEVSYSDQDIVLESKTVDHQSDDIVPYFTKIRLSVLSIDGEFVAIHFGHPKSPTIPFVIAPGVHAILLSCQYITDKNVLTGVGSTDFAFQFMSGKKYELFYTFKKLNRGSGISCVPGIKEK